MIIIFFQNRVFTTLENDPLFAHTVETLPIEKQRELAFQRCKRLFEYDFLTDDELFENPIKNKIMRDCISMYDLSVGVKYILDMEVRNDSEYCL